jgi:hypothetical protein
MFDRVQDRALAGPLKDIQKLVLKSLLRCLGCVLTIVVLLEGEHSPQSEVLSTFHLCQSDHWVLGHLPDQGPSPLIAQFDQAATSGKSLGGSKGLTFKNDGNHCVLGDFQCFRHFLVPFPRSVP